MIGPASLKRLEALVQQAAERLKALGEDNDKLLRANKRLEDDNKALKEQVRALQAAASKGERVRQRLLRLSQKLDKLDKIA